MGRDEVHAACDGTRHNQVGATRPGEMAITARHRLGEADQGHRVEEPQEVDLPPQPGNRTAPSAGNPIDEGPDRRCTAREIERRTRRIDGFLARWAATARANCVSSAARPSRSTLS